VAFAITASPATLIQMARIANEHGETLIRDVHDGTLSHSVVAEPGLRRALSAGLRPDPARAQRLAGLRDEHGALRPRDYWQLEFLACWTGGSMGYYLQRLAEWWGPIPVRDIGLLASEGRVSIPLQDNTPAGVLDVTSGVFEFIPIEQADTPEPRTLRPRELETGHEYVVVLSNTSGLVRQAPLVEFLRRSGRVASVTGEKLTEDQVIAAVQAARTSLGMPELDFVIAPCWDDPPHYRLTCTGQPDQQFATAVDHALCQQNEEYDSRRKSGRLGMLRIRAASGEAIRAMDQRLAAARRAAPEQYKRVCLFVAPGDDDRALGLLTETVR
jgi:hypothetical protein